jgi:hypothetical protein
MDNIGPTFIAVLTSIVGLAMVAVIVSKRAQTPSVIQAGGAALASVIGAAVTPVTGGNGGATNFGSAASTVGGASS